MNLSRLNFWKTNPSLAATQATESHMDRLDNVVQLPLGTVVESPAGLASESPTSVEHSTSQNSKTNIPGGLMAAPELLAFFANNFFGLGRHNGSHYKTQDAQAQGKAALVSQFQNAVAAVIGQKQAKVDGLRNMELQTEGVCHTATAQLGLACTRLERDMATLQNQMDLATEGKGWVLAALNEYQIGFGKGMREAIDAEVLGL
jgi:hypothetical protein